MDKTADGLDLFFTSSRNRQTKDRRKMAKGKVISCRLQPTQASWKTKAFLSADSSAVKTTDVRHGNTKAAPKRAETKE